MDDYQNGDRDLVHFHRKSTANDRVGKSFGLQTELVRPRVNLTLNLLHVAQLDVQLPQLLLAHRAGRMRKQALGTLCFGKGDNIAD